MTLNADKIKAVAQRPASHRGRFFRTVLALILREAETRYSRVFGGYLWALLEPVAAIFFLTAIFSLLSRTPALGSNFPLFYATGFLPYSMFMGISTSLAQAIQFSRPLLQYPAITFLDALVARLILNLITHGLVMMVVLVVIVRFYDISLIIDWYALGLGVAMVVALGSAIGIMNCYLTLAMPIWSTIWAIATRPLFIISGVIFLPDNLSEQMRDHLMLNPIAHFVSVFRSGIYSIYDASYANPLYVFGISIIIGTIGMLLLARNYKTLLLR